jgi:hypothetical protein
MANTPNRPTPRATPIGDDAPAPAVVAPLPTKPQRFISEGVRVDIMEHGSTIDPLTGDTLTRDDL